jgi:hypothetical protein
MEEIKEAAPTQEEFNFTYIDSASFSTLTDRDKCDLLMKWGMD